MRCSICKTTYWTGGHLAPADCVPVLRDALAAERTKREEAERVMRTALDDAHAFRVERDTERARSAALMRALIVLSQ